jgi:hypothetical protein
MQETGDGEKDERSEDKIRKEVNNTDGEENRRRKVEGRDKVRKEIRRWRRKRKRRKGKRRI